MYCSHCGKLIPAEANVEYCPACGSRIATAQAVAGKPARNETGIGVAAKDTPKINIHKVLNIGWIALSIIMFLCLAAPFVKGSFLIDEMTGYDVVASISDDEDAKNEQASAVLIIAMMVYGVIGIICALASLYKNDSGRKAAYVNYIIEGSALSIMILVCRKFMANALGGYTQLIGEGVSYTTVICFIMCAFAVMCFILSYSNGEIRESEFPEYAGEDEPSFKGEEDAEYYEGDVLTKDKEDSKDESFK